MKCRADFAMLVQLVALLSLGMLCSSAPAAQTSRPTSSPLEGHPKSLVAAMIREAIKDVENLSSNEVPGNVTVPAKMERCMHSQLKTFALTLEALGRPSKHLAGKLNNIYENIFPKDLDKECETLQVTGEVFLRTLGTFLRLLFEKIQD